MSLIAKLGAVGVGGGAIAVGGTYLWKHINDVMPPWHSLADDKNYKTKSENTGEYSGKYGATYSKYLIGVEEASDGKTPKDNDPWWDWIYLNIFSKVESHKGKFKNVKQAIGGDSSSLSLKLACTDAYKEKNDGDDKKIKTGNQVNDGDYDEEDIWKYCSPIGQKPTTLDNSKNKKEKEGYQNKLGGTQDKTSKFISVEDPGNTIFWQIRQEEFFSSSGKFSPASESENDLFKSFYTEEQSKPKEQRKTIKDKCKEAYSKPTTGPQTNTNPAVEKIVKFCSLDGQ